MKNTIRGNILEPLFWKNKGSCVWPLYKQYSAWQWDAKEIYLNRLNQRIAKLLIHAKDNIPYYKNIILASHEQINRSPKKILKNLPIMRKSFLVDNHDLLFNDINRGLYKNSTGGSTGEPVSLIQDKHYLDSSLATTYLMYEWAGKKPGNTHLKLWGAERDLVDGKIGYKQRCIDWVFSRKTLNSFSMGPQKQREYLDCIKKNKPTLLEGYADSLFELSKFGEINNVEGATPNAIVSSAGTLYGHMREKIETFFNCSVFDRYGSREAGNMAAECEYHNGLHIFGETTYLEVVNEQDQQVKEGEEGRLLVTNLHNFTMPLLRYEIGDLAIMGSKNCGCGRPYPLLKKIVGRQSGSFKRKDGGVVSPAFFIHCIGVMCNDGAVKRYQAIQNDINSITIKIIPVNNLYLDSWPMAEKIKKLINNAMGSECCVNFEIVNTILLSPTGKHLYTICNVADE